MQEFGPQSVFQAYLYLQSPVMYGRKIWQQWVMFKLKYPFPRGVRCKIRCDVKVVDIIEVRAYLQRSQQSTSLCKVIWDY